MRDIPAVPDHEIELAGGALALDFANTVGGTHVRPTHDHLRSYADIVRFTEMADGLDAQTAQRLARRAQQDPRRAAAVYERGTSPDARRFGACFPRSHQARCRARSTSGSSATRPQRVEPVNGSSTTATAWGGPCPPTATRWSGRSGRSRAPRRISLRRQSSTG